MFSCVICCRDSVRVDSVRVDSVRAVSQFCTFRDSARANLIALPIHMQTLAA